MDDNGFDIQGEEIIFVSLFVCFFLSFSFWPIYTYSL